MVSDMFREDLPPVVGVSGKSGSGKDKFYATVLAKLGYTRLALADAVRVLSSILLVRSLPGIMKNEKEILRIFPSIYREFFVMDKDPFSRTYLQYVGTDLARNYDEDYWVKTLDPLVEERLNKGIKVAITDVRFPNESRYVKSKGGVVVLATGESRYSKDSFEASHPSESLEGVEFDMTAEEFVQRFLGE